jgi:hypothetical protein
MPDLREVQKELAALRAARDAASVQARAAVLRAGEAKNRRIALERIAHGSDRPGDEVTALDREIAALEAEAQKRRAQLVNIESRVGGLAEELVTAPIDQLLASLDDHVPFLLFPVRLETKFAHGSDGVHLRVRIFPDNVNISAHDPLLSEGERASGAAYWAARTRALALDADGRRAAEVAAWTMLASRYGGPRARYVARQTEPAVWPSQDGVPLGAAPSAPSTAEDDTARPSYSSVPPRARLLPDYFTVIGLDHQDREVARAIGGRIPDTLQLGPDPEALEAELKRSDDGRLATDPKLAWLVDFDKAVEVGMAVTLPVPPAQARAGFHRIVALGAKLSMDPDAGASAVETLLAEHRYTDGIDLLRNGTPTNNADDAPSGFTTGLAADEALVAVEVEKLLPVAVLEHAKKPDAQRVAEALGIAFETVSDWPSAREVEDIADALAMNRALWPATLGRFLQDMIGERMSPTLKSEIERFFLTYVTGRTLLPNIRVGAQPYGVLVTSDFRAWTEEAGDERNHMGEIAAGLAWLRRNFEAVAADSETRVFQVGGGGQDALANSMRVLGQLASSVSFASRKAVTDEASWNTLQFIGVVPVVARRWWEQRVAQRAAAFSLLQLNPANLPLADLVFFHEADLLAVPIVDQDPELPLSENDEITAFDGTRNYIDWLLTATTEELRTESFQNTDGESIDPPKALLYRLLHTAWTSQLATSSSSVVKRLRADLIATDLNPSIVNVGAYKVVPDAQAALFDSAKMGFTRNPRALGDYLLDLSTVGLGFAGPVPPEALPLQSQRAALGRLARRSTAALERLFAEHVDTASYRLDAWQTGLAARRLDHMRRREGRARGLYVGAYGYVEDLVPKPAPTPVSPRELPELLRESGVTEQADNGGFVHAPSLAHAATAAVLRNGYLTHAEPAARDVMSVNLGSRRVRVALELIEGVRAGQSLGALLGYQLERGLHEGHPGVELDTFIYGLRARFPLVSRRLTDVPEDAAAEVIEARNVVDGEDFLEYVRANPSYPYDLAALLPPAGTEEAAAVQEEVDRLEDALDAVADLMLAESVHQVLQSNMDRARGVFGAIGDGEAPPLPDVAQTPRSGRALTQRVALHLPPPGPGWLATPGPRAAANRRLDTWLVRQLPPPGAIGFEVRAPAATPQIVTLAQSGLDALDLILMTADRLGDGSTEIERWLVDRWRSDNDVGDEIVVRYAGSPAEGEIIFDWTAATGATPLARLLPQLRALRRLVTMGRSLDAQDYRLSDESRKADPANPKGYLTDAAREPVNLPGLVTAARDDLRQAADALEAELGALGTAYDALRADAASFVPADWLAPLATLRGLLRRLVQFGAAEALPRSAAGVSVGAALELVEQGRATLVSIRRRLDAADTALAPLPPEPPREDPGEEARRLAGRLDLRIENLRGAARATLGAGFPLQPLFAFDAEARTEIDARLSTPIEADPLALEAWLQSLARVRPRMADVALASAAALWTTGAEPKLVPVQLPRRSGDPWIGKAWSAPPADREVMSVMTLDPPDSLAGELEGLLLDEWTETVPGLRETTGVAFHFDRPGAEAPHALLLAVPPKPDGTWNWSELLGVVVDTFARARLRAIEPDQIAASPLFPVLPAILTPFSSGGLLAETFLPRDVMPVRATEG